MKKILFTVGLLVFLLTFWVGPRIITAAGTTSTPNQAGELKLVDENGVMYVTTEANGNQVYVVKNTTTTSRVILNQIDVPASYAQSFNQLINFIMRLVLAVSALLVFAFLIWGAFDWITSGGDKGKVEHARGKIVAAVVGLIIIASSYAVLNLVLSFLGFGSLQAALESVGTIQHGPLPTPTTDLGVLITATPSATPN